MLVSRHVIGLLLGAALLAATLLAAVGRPAQAQPVDPEIGVVGGGVAQRLESVVSLCEDGDFDALRYALFDASPTVRQLAVSCWDTTIGGVDVLSTIVHDSSPAVRTSLAEVLARDDDIASEELLTSMLVDDEASIRAIAASGLDFSEATAAANHLAPLLNDTDLNVVAAAAEGLERANARHLLTDEQIARYESALTVAELHRQLPEMIGALNAVQEQLRGLIRELERAGPDEASCSDATLSALEAASLEARELVRVSAADKPIDRFELLLAFQHKLNDLIRAYHTCLSATPLVFDSLQTSAPFTSASVLIKGEVASNWWINFGLLRADLDEPAGGELWVVGDAVINAYFPGRPGGLTAPSQVPSLDLSGMVRRDQLYRNNELSSWNWGVLVRGDVPFGCGSLESCRFTGLALAEQTLGSDADFPSRLVASRREVDGELALQVPVGSVLGTLLLDGALVRYQQNALNPADLNTAGVHLTIDSPFQLEMGATRNNYPNNGPINSTEGGRTDENADLDRDNFVLDTMIGVRFGGSDPSASLRLLFLGGVAFPLFDVLDESIDPQITFEARMTAQSGSIGGDLSRMRLGGYRRVEAAAQDYALQTITHSYIDYIYQGVEPPESGVRFSIAFWHELVQGYEPLVQEAPTDTNLIGGTVDVRFLLVRWLGFEAANDILAVRFENRDFRVENRFMVSIFLPLGIYDFGLVEDMPW